MSTFKRIVKMTFRPEEVDNFLALFAERSPKIRARKGCVYLELWRSREPSNVLFTYSLWESEEDLNAYRHSELFGDTWKRTKALFADGPKAWSVDTVVVVEEGV
ncbi:MAG: antibiotic biosynthesis monooxygenase family protein [Bacteroidota bacterium]